MAVTGAHPDEILDGLAAVDDWIERVLNRRYLNHGVYSAAEVSRKSYGWSNWPRRCPSAWVRQATDHDQPSALAALPLPVLSVAAEADWRVPPAEARALADALEGTGRSGWELMQMPGVNHRLVAVDNMEAALLMERAADYGQQLCPVAPAVLDRPTITLTTGEATQ